MGNLRNEKRLQYERDYYIRNKSRKLLAKYGITEEAYEEMLLEQGGVCAICNGTNTNGKVLSVDHDHDTDAVRGLLCSRCTVTWQRLVGTMIWTSRVRSFLSAGGTR
jgi:hypothetical protein